MDQKVSTLTTIGSVDRTADFLYIVDTSLGTSNKVTPNALFGITTGSLVSTTDTQTLTGKTLTAPTISSPVISGTITGTYTIGGTPTFPATVVLTTGSQTLTGKTLTSPTINTPTIVNATISANAVTGFTTANTGTIYGVPITLGVISTASTVNGSAVVAGTIGNSALAVGTVVQVVSTNFTAVTTGSTIIPVDDTIPQITEGVEFMTQVITPKSTTNILVIEVIGMYANTANGQIVHALFQDSTVNALAAASIYDGNFLNNAFMLPLSYTMVAGTTSATTFRIRAGSEVAHTLTFNGTSGVRRFGAIAKSFIKITEYKA